MAWQPIDQCTWKFEGRNLSEPQAFCFYPLTLPAHRNARAKFSIKFEGGFKAYHAALCFRRIDERSCYGVGLGGWNGKFSFFQQTQFGFQRESFGDENFIEPDREFEFEVQFKGNRLAYFNALGNGGTKIISSSILPRAYMRGGLALYGYGGPTRAVLKLLEYEDLGLSAFMICRIDGNENDKCKRVKDILKKKGVNLEVIDGDAIETYPGLMRSILDKMLESDFVISWFMKEGFWFKKGLRQNVAYETGIAHALNIPTVHIIGDIKDRPSDLGAQFFITEHDLARKLPNDVDAILKQERNEVRYLI